MIILTGGKTGGHVYPLISLAKNINCEFLYVGGKGLIEENICKSNNIHFYGLNISKNYVKLIKESFKIKFIKKPTLIIASGGYVSIPVVLYGIRKKIPIFLYEENVILGNFNKLFYPFCKKLLLAWNSIKLNKGLYCGLPFNRIINNVKHYDILVIGGSLGSKPLCELALKLKMRYKVLLIAGNYYSLYKDKKNIDVIKYTDDLCSYMANSNLIISRAGASTISEVFNINKPLIIIPSKKTKKNHQVKNAIYWKKNNCCYYLDEKNLNDGLHIVNRIYNDKDYINNMIINQKRIVNSNCINIIKDAIDDEI